MWVLDTDHVSLIVRGDPQVAARLRQVAMQTTTTIITVQEFFNGWITQLNESDAKRTSSQQANEKREQILYQYRRLFLSVELIKTLPVLEFDVSACDRYEFLLQQHPLLRKKALQKDMRIAAIALSRNATVVTRNHRDFGQVPGLKIEDWTI